MTQSSGGRKGAKLVVRNGVLVLVFAVVVLATAFFVAPAQAAPSAPSAASPSEQWAFGGTASGNFACQNSNCFNDSSFVGSFSVGYKVSWVVIYTRTNVSPSQTMLEGKAALRASANFAYSQTSGGSTEAMSASVSGLETAAGFTNVTSGTVSLTSASNLTTWTSPALAIMNAASQKAFNFSGSASIQSPNGSGTVNFDLGGNSSSSVAFTPSLGILPESPQPGDMWSAVAPFTASGSWTSGYSLSLAGAAGASVRDANWTTHSVAGSGVLGVNGTDLGAVTLYDNYTSPPTTVTAQVVYLDFGSAAFTLSDGWMIVPSNLYSGALSGLSGTGATGSSGTSNETAYYRAGTGIVGAGIAGSAAVPVGAAGSSPVALSLQAGPEPVGVAESQYAAITGASGSSSGFPWIWVVLGVVIVVVVASVALISRRSRMHRPPPTAWAPEGAPSPAVPADPNPGGGPLPPSPPGL